VEATDVRPVGKEQVQSLGGTFIEAEMTEEEKAQAETAGGYAREMSDDYKRRQAELVAETLKKQDIAICTALIPGRKAPTLITADMVRSMRPGSVIVDLAAEQGGNCELTKAGETVEVDGVTIIGLFNIPSRLSADANSNRLSTSRIRLSTTAPNDASSPSTTLAARYRRATAGPQYRTPSTLCYERKHIT
jgi:NAD(P) transhydrogenase subunit alpha